MSGAGEANLSKETTVYMVVLDTEAEPSRPKFDLAEMIARMPTDYQAVKEGFGLPVGKEM